MFSYKWTGVFIWLIWNQIDPHHTAEVPEEILLIARCRVNCMEKITNEENHQESGSFDTCWQTCGFLYQEYDFWNRFCLLEEICNYGCQAACDFHRGIPSGIRRFVLFLNSSTGPAYRGDLFLTNKNTLNYGHVGLKISNRKRREHFKEHPKAKLSSSSIHISWSSSSEERSKRMVYVLVKQDIRTKDWISIFQTSSLSASFKALNISENCVFLLLAVDRKGIIAEEKFVIHLPTNRDNPPMRQNGKTNRKGSLISYKNFTEIDNNLVLMLRLIYTPKLKTRKPIPTDFFVDWFLDDCGIYLDAPECDLPPQHYGPSRATIDGDKIVVILTNVLYNSLYTIKLEGSGNYERSFEVKTPKCYTPDSFFTHCNRIEVILSKKEPTKFKIITDSLFFNKNLNKMVGNFSWNASIGHGNVRYIISWQAPGDLSLSNILMAGKAETPYPNVTLSLEPSLIYKLEVQAVSGDLDNKTLRSAPLYVNTSVLVGKTSTNIMDIKKYIFPDDSLMLNLFAAIVFAVVVVTSIAVATVCQKRRKLKNIVITKNIVSKSNSYKSNVSGYKMDYSCESNVTSDEWELDPNLLEFSTPLGQGAFGKVVCGYYCKRKVAIKVVRDSAPLSYKEDLLAEMHLMKKIGRHPNIVTMIGACTKSEPIAIVMEFVPNGNLLSYLIKCRHETEDGYAEMDGNNSDKDTLTPIQMLSFARQISMAMQYLSENKYVHRDLAARNILLDQNKVVKICDFGLSRDIYKDQIYQKLTSGKLPIKWMAIESLKDRIFTTYSDVWSFGILLWEIVTMGASPYPGIPLEDLYHVLSSGYRMEKPNNCSEELYHIMRLTWAEKPKDRPEFHQLKLMIEDLLSKNSNYLDLAHSDHSSESQTTDTNSANH